MGGKTSELENLHVDHTSSVAPTNKGQFTLGCVTLRTWNTYGPDSKILLSLPERSVPP